MGAEECSLLDELDGLLVTVLLEAVALVEEYSLLDVLKTEEEYVSVVLLGGMLLSGSGTADEPVLLLEYTLLEEALLDEPEAVDELTSGLPLEDNTLLGALPRSEEFSVLLQPVQIIMIDKAAASRLSLFPIIQPIPFIIGNNLMLTLV